MYRHINSRSLFTSRVQGWLLGSPKGYMAAHPTNYARESWDGGGCCPMAALRRPCHLALVLAFFAVFLSRIRSRVGALWSYMLRRVVMFLLALAWCSSSSFCVSRSWLRWHDSCQWRFRASHVLVNNSRWNAGPWLGYDSSIAMLVWLWSWWALCASLWALHRCLCECRVPSRSCWRSRGQGMLEG